MYAQGQDRTSTVLALWLHHRYLLTPEEAMHEVTAHGAGKFTARPPLAVLHGPLAAVWLFTILLCMTCAITECRTIRRPNPETLTKILGGWAAGASPAPGRNPSRPSTGASVVLGAPSSPTHGGGSGSQTHRSGTSFASSFYSTSTLGHAASFRDRPGAVSPVRSNVPPLALQGACVPMACSPAPLCP